MTEPGHVRGGPAARRVIGYRSGGGLGYATGGGGSRSRSAVGEQLREAREARGFDLFRVERDTKIRLKYLEALESGDFAELPAEVYARGFLRNYASYLGLDADELVDQWRRETGERPASSPVLTAPTPVRVRREFRFERIHVVIAAVAVVVLIVASFFTFQLTRFLQYPALGMTNPTGVETITVTSGTTSYVLEGTATAGTTVLISWDGQDPTTVIVGDSGKWSYTAQLHFGSNQFDITAVNLDTNHSSKTSKVIIQVPVVTPTPPAPAVAFVTPAEGAEVSTAAVAVTGTSQSTSSISITATYAGAPALSGATAAPATPAASGASPGPTLPPGAAPAPSPATVSPNADGSFTFSLQLSPGRWQLMLVGRDLKGLVSAPVYRTISVPYKNLTVLVEVKGGDATDLHLAGDGKLLTELTRPDGWSMAFNLTSWFCASSRYQADRVYITVNGVSYGTIGSLGGTRFYVAKGAAPKNPSACPV
jgi:cytoskeletal protein RodZ